MAGKETLLKGGKYRSPGGLIVRRGRGRQRGLKDQRNNPPCPSFQNVLGENQLASSNESFWAGKGGKNLSLGTERDYPLGMQREKGARSKGGRRVTRIYNLGGGMSRGKN